MFDVLVTAMLVILLPFIICFATLATVKPAFVHKVDAGGKSYVSYTSIFMYSVLASLLVAFIVKMYTDKKENERVSGFTSHYCSGKPHSSF